MAKRLTEERIEMKSGRFFWSMESGRIRIFISMARGSQPETQKRRNIITTTQRSCSLRITRIREIILNLWQTTIF